MKILITSIGFILIVNCCFGQVHKRISTYLQTQYTHTLYDKTAGNNPAGMGFGLQTLFDVKSKFKLVLEGTGDLYLLSDKVAVMDTDSTVADDVGSNLSVYAGASFHPSRKVYFSMLMGLSFINETALFSLKPTFGFNLSENGRWIGKLSYINVFNRSKTNEDFGSLSFAIGVKLF
jgi:hypothetical protein